MSDDRYPLIEQPPDAVIDETKRAVDSALADPNSIASRRVLGQVFEQELDEIHTPEGSSYFSEHAAPRADEERARREERYLMAHVASAARAALTAQGMKVETGYAESFGVVQDGEYTIRATDREGRVFDASYGLELAKTVGGNGRDLVIRMGQAVAREILKKRHIYFERAGLAPEVA